MFSRQELKRLELRRRELVVQSTLNRLAFVEAWQQLETAWRPVERVVSTVRSARPWLLAVAPLAGFIAARRFRRGGSILTKALGVLRWIQPLLAVWRQFGAKAEPSPHVSKTESSSTRQ